MRRHTPAALAALLVLCLAGSVGAQGFAWTGNCTLNNWPCWMAYPAAADNGKALTYSSTLRQAVWSTLSAALIANGSEGQILRSGASAPAWTTATWPATTTANQLLYSSATNTVGGLTSANSAVLSTNSSGVPA